MVLGGEEVEVEGFEEGVGGFGGVEEGADTVAAGEGGGGHEGAVEDVAFLDLGVVEEDLEADGVEDGDDSGVGGNERAWRHVCAEDCGVVFFDSGREELVTSLFVKVVVSVFVGSQEIASIGSRDWF